MLWSQGACGKIMPYFSSHSCCMSCWCLPRGWLLASLARCVCWGSLRSVLLSRHFKKVLIVYSLYWMILTPLYHARSRSGYFLLPAVLPTSISLRRYIDSSCMHPALLVVCIYLNLGFTLSSHFYFHCTWSWGNHISSLVYVIGK